MTFKDEAAWKRALARTESSYDLAIYTYAERWATLMEERIRDGASLDDVFESTSHEADTEGITGFMFGAAVAILGVVWKHGEELRRLHNKSYGEESTKGTVNPAILIVNSKGDY